MNDVDQKIATLKQQLESSEELGEEVVSCKISGDNLSKLKVLRIVYSDLLGLSDEELIEMLLIDGIMNRTMLLCNFKDKLTPDEAS